MDNAQILRGGRVIKSSGFIGDTVDNLDGFLIEFTASNTTYFYREASQFRKEDYKNMSEGVKAGYYKKDVFLNYYARLGGVELSSVRNSILDIDKSVRTADVGDIIWVKALLIQTPYEIYYENVMYKYPYDGNRSNVINAQGKIIIPQTASATPYEVASSTIEAKTFYNNRKSIIATFPSAERDNIALVIVKIALTVNMINKEIFPNFLTSTQDLSGYINAQNQHWQTGNIFENYELKDFEKYLKDLLDYYKIAHANQALIRYVTGKDKIYWLANILTAESLTLLPLPNRLEVLKTLALKETLDDGLEEFALKIINSVNINNQSDVNTFLGFLIDEKFPTGYKTPPYSENIYSLLYKKIDNYNAILKGTLELVGNYGLSKDNKTRFVNTIFALWTESRYNPYKNTTSTGEPDYSLFDNKTFDYDKNLHHFSILNYSSKRNTFGIYDDDFTFEFDPWAEGIYWITQNDDYSLISHTSMHLYQPISLISYPSEMDVSIQIPEKDGELNGVLPLFYLAYLDKDGDRADFNTKVGIFVDVIATFSGIGNIFKLRHLRYLSKMGQVLLIIETVQVGAGVISFLLNYSGLCNDTPFCKKLKTLLFFVEISALVTDPIAIAKAKKSASNLVEEGIENGWPSGMLDEIESATPKSKIEQIAGIGVVEYLDRYVASAKKDLLQLIENENKALKELGKVPSLKLYYGNSRIDEILLDAASKGLSKEDGMGIIHQACRIRKTEIIADVTTLKNRLDNVVLVRRRGYPFTFETLADFNNYAKNKVGTTLDKFGLPKDRAYFSGSSITSQSSISGDVFDTDWAIRFGNKEEFNAFVLQIEKRYYDALDKGVLVNNKKITEGYVKTKVKDMQKNYAKSNYRKIHKRYIIGIEEGRLVNLEEVLKRDFPEAIKTDITPVIDGVNAGFPRIKFIF